MGIHTHLGSMKAAALVAALALAGCGPMAPAERAAEQGLSVQNGLTPNGLSQNGLYLALGLLRARLRPALAVLRFLLLGSRSLPRPETPSRAHSPSDSNFRS